MQIEPAFAGHLTRGAGLVNQLLFICGDLRRGIAKLQIVEAVFRQRGERRQRLASAPEMNRVDQNTDILAAAGGDKRLGFGDGAQLCPGHGLQVHG